MPIIYFKGSTVPVSTGHFKRHLAEALSGLERTHDTALDLDFTLPVADNIETTFVEGKAFR